MSDTKKTTKSTASAAASKIEGAQETLSNATANLRETATDTTAALRESATAYATGMSELVKAFYGIGQEVAQETVEHGKSSMKANCVKNLAEMQAGYVQHRIESSSVHMKTIADVAADNLTKVYAPLLGLMKDRKAA